MPGRLGAAPSTRALHRWAMNAFEEDVQDAFERFEETGNGLDLLRTLMRAAQYGIPAPYEAYWALREALERYESAESRTLDDALKVSRPARWNQSAEKERIGRGKCHGIPGMSRISCLWYRARALHAEGMKKDDALWETLADEFHVSAGRAKQWFYEIEAITKASDK